MRRRIIASLMAFLLLGSFLLSPVQVNRSLAGMEKADYLGEYEGQELLRGTGIVLFGVNGTPGSVHYFYSDAYFADPSKTYDKHLSSYAMTLSAASGADANVAKILGECGFKDVEIVGIRMIYSRGFYPQILFRKTKSSVKFFRK